MAQAPADLRPLESPRHYLGAELRAWRLLRGLSLAQLGGIVHASGDLLGKIEKAQRRPTEDLIRRCDSALDAAETLTRLHELIMVSPHASPDCVDPRTTSVPKSRSAIRGIEDTAPSDSDSNAHSSAKVVSLAAYRRRKLASVS